jgi:hypothetical protein
MLKHALKVSFGKHELSNSPPERIRRIDKVIIALCFAVLLILGLWIPFPLRDFLMDAVAIVEHGVAL